MVEYNKEYALRQLCNELNIELKHGGQQTKNAISKIKRDYEIEKVNNKYVIIRELSEYEKMEQIRYNKAKEYIEPLLYNILLNEPENETTKSIPELAQALFLVNSNYYESKYNFNKEIPFDLYTEQEHYYNFLDETSLMITRIIDDILDDMQSRSLILWNRELTYAKKSIDKNKKTEVWKCPNESEFLKVQENVWNQYGIEKMSDIYKRREDGLSPNKIKSYIRQDISTMFDISYYFYKRHIVLNKQGIKSRLSMLEYSRLANEYACNKFLESQQGYLKLIERDLKERIVNYSTRINFDIE